jgi:predicted O-methyltransferase YrrM
MMTKPVLTCSIKNRHAMASLPICYAPLFLETQAAGFSMASDPRTGALLRALAGSKPGGRLLELGTGTGLATCWILDGMRQDATLVSVDNEKKFLDIARKYLGQDPRLELVCSDAGEWIQQYGEQRFDFIFADTWHGKYLLLEEALAMLRPGGIYLIDDMLPQPNWPDGHGEKVHKLVQDLESRSDLVLAKLDWSTGLMLAAKR